LREAEGESAHVVQPHSDALPPPEEAGDRYQLQGEIARGGMGAVLRGRRVAARLEFTALASATATACLVLALWQPPDAVGWFAAWLLAGCLFLYVYSSGVYATIQDLMEPALRGTAMALYFAVMYLFAAFGPVVAGSLSRYLATRAAAAVGSAAVTEWHRAVALHGALGLVPVLGALLVVVLYLASRAVTADYDRLQRCMATQGSRCAEGAGTRAG
jgi:MFS family permease